MQYIYSEQPTDLAAEDAATSIAEHLSAGERVLLLLSGGSGIKIALGVQSRLAGLSLSNLYVTLADERFGELDGANENWRQLLDAGLTLDGASLYRPLDGKNIDETTDNFNNWLSQNLSLADYKIGIFGIGSDNHTAGIKPNSQPTDTKNYAYSYTGDDFDRITISNLTIVKLDKIVAQASGADKLEAIEKLFADDYPINTYPNQILQV